MLNICFPLTSVCKQVNCYWTSNSVAYLVFGMHRDWPVNGDPHPHAHLPGRPIDAARGRVTFSFLP